MTSTAKGALSSGSAWHRWDPHIHTPGTIMANEFRGPDPWGEFLDRVEQSSPAIRALGITDYWNLNEYSKVRAFKAQGRLASVDLVFANVELRLDIHTEKKIGINLHLLFSPEDSEHTAEIERFLGRLTFSYLGRPYECTRDGLVRLGKAFDSSASGEQEALRIGANQFKVTIAQLQEEWKQDTWVQHNCLVAVSGSSNDGTAGLAPDDSFRATREEIERFAQIIFASQAKQRDFWLGYGALSRNELEARLGGVKPCLHGSDAHTQARVGAPVLNRYTWIKGDPTFESLRQACIEPENRAIVAEQFPSGALPANVITQVNVSNAPWLPQYSVPLNSGLVAIIGARGSGKTALADLIAAGGYAASPHLNDRSFIRRARPYLQEASAELVWQGGETTSAALTEVEWEEQYNEPQVQYLSQQFVDQLCSAEGLDHSLLSEIERVIFNAHSISDRVGTSSFRELLETRLAAARLERERSNDQLSHIADEIAEERTRKAGLAKLQQQRAEKFGNIEKNKKDRGALLSKGNATDAVELNRVRDAVELKRQRVGDLKQVERAVRGLLNEVTEYRLRTLPRMIEGLQTRWSEARLTSTEWAPFRLDFQGNVDELLARKLQQAQQAILTEEGAPEPLTIMASVPAEDILKSHLPPNGILQNTQLRTLEREMKRLNTLVGLDAANARRLSELSDRISREESELRALDQQIERAKTAEGRIREL